ncbi:MAG: hypothetical protein JW839_18330 [Candidatus Lokiarchaeota archaeon]|nr:hypothetical protein [Candidatus Lokiarchaeota archaeon]
MTEPYTLFKIISGSVATAMLAAGFAILFKQFCEKRYRPSLYLSIAWLGFMLEALFDTIHLVAKALDEPNTIYLKVSYISLAPKFLGVLSLVDSISRESIETKRFSITVFLLGINTIILFMPLDEMALAISYYLVISIGIFISTYTFFLYIKIQRNVPAGLKRAAIMNVLGSFCVSVVYVFVNVLEATLPGALPPVSRLFEAGGALIQTLVFAKHEQLFYILPFKAQRLIVFDTKKGISLFLHDWSKEGQLIDEDLFSGILHGMGMIVNESIQKGNVQEITMERGVLLISHDNVNPIAFVIIASKSSQVLKQALAAFRRKYVREFEGRIGSMLAAGDLEAAADLVRKSFPFIPQFV